MTGTFRDSSDMRRYAPICIDMRRYGTIYADMRQYVQICADMHRYAPIYAVMRQCARRRAKPQRLSRQVPETLAPSPRNARVRNAFTMSSRLCSQCRRVRNGITRERARNVFRETRCAYLNFLENVARASSRISVAHATIL